MAALSDIGSSIIRTVMAQNDAFRIRCYGCLNDNSTGDGKVEFATADDGTEPIYVRQYKGNANDYFGDIVHEACLLDSNGNTSFPGTIYGNLRGMLLPVSEINDNIVLAMAEGDTATVTELKAEKEAALAEYKTKLEAVNNG